MRRLLFLLLTAVFVLPLQAQVGVLSVSDENKYETKEDFYHTFEYFISNSAGQGAKCQATRIGRRWFATAAHCVAELCREGCTLQLDLLEQPVSALAAVTHSPKKPAVFIFPGYSSNTFVKNDFALFRLDLDRTPLTYYRRATPKRPYNAVLRQSQFQAFLDKNRRAKSQFAHIKSPQFPALVLFDEGNYRIDRKLSVVSIFGGKREIKPNPYPVYYLKQLGFAYTTNFGIRQGMSGSGVMANTGELVGIISAHLTSSQISALGDTKTKDYFVFPVFNAEVASFMESVMGSDYYKLDWKDCFPSFVRKTGQRDKTVLNAVEWVNKHGVSKK